MSAADQTICWSCANACGGCSWSKYKVQKPVKGWEAEPTALKGNGKAFDSYIVRACPLYVPDGRSEINDNKEEIDKVETKKQKTNWTPQLLHDMQRLREEGLPVPEIAERLGVDATAVRNKLARMNAKAIPAAEERAETETVSCTTERRESDPLTDEMIFKSFGHAVALCRQKGVSVERCWRVLLSDIEEQLAGCAAVARQYPSVCKHLTAVAAIIAADKRTEKESAQREGNPN